MKKNALALLASFSLLAGVEKVFATNPTCPLNHPAGTNNLFLVFKGGHGDLLHLDWFNLVSSRR